VIFKHSATQERSTLMSDVKFIGLDVHKTSMSAAVLDERAESW